MSSSTLMSFDTKRLICTRRKDCVIVTNFLSEWYGSVMTVASSDADSSMNAHQPKGMRTG